MSKVETVIIRYDNQILGFYFPSSKKKSILNNRCTIETAELEVSDVEESIHFISDGSETRIIHNAMMGMRLPFFGDWKIVSSFIEKEDIKKEFAKLFEGNEGMLTQLSKHSWDGSNIEFIMKYSDKFIESFLNESSSYIVVGRGRLTDED
jgi:hypothetical protein